MLLANTYVIAKKWLGVFLLLVISVALKAQSNPPYSITWIGPSGVSVNGGILTRTASGGSWGGAISSNLLSSSTDGWLEFTAVSGVNYIVGFAENNIYSYNRFTQGLQFSSTNATVLAREGSADGVSLGNFQSGDVFRISREGGSVKYYKNDVVLRTVSALYSVELKAKAILLNAGTSTPNITTSFDSQLVVYGTVTSASTNSSTGAIALSVSGGAAPYTYSWSSDENTSSISNKPQGTYSVTVTDNVGRTSTRSYNIGYEVDWIYLAGVTNNAGQLTRIAPDGTGNSGAISSNLLPANTNGWIEFVGINGHDFMMGLTVNGSYSYSQYSNCISLDNETGRATAYENNGVSVPLGSFQTGDIFRISREGSAVKYYRNGVAVRTINVSSSLELKVKAVVFNAGNTTAKVTTSFDSRLFVYGSVIGLDGNSGATGSISLSVVGGTPPYTYNWTSGEHTSTLTNKARGAYTVTVIDDVGRTQTRTYNIGYKANWINLAGVTSSSNGRLTKTAQDNQWTSGAVSSNILPANTDGWIEFVPASGQNFRLGLAANNIINYTQFTNSIFIDPDLSRAVVYEGSSSISLGNFQTGDVLRISREGSVVRYYRNDDILRTVSVNPDLVLRVKASLLITNSYTALVNTSFWLSDGVVRTYYSIADGSWTTPSIWSLTENGPPSTVYPYDIDKVVIKGHAVTINSAIKTAGVTIISTNESTKLKVDGNMAVLTVKGNVVMNRENNQNTAEVLLVQNNGKLDVKNP